MPKPVGSSRYMPGLDGLRAIAVLAVIAYHLNLSWVPGGLLGVGIFFVLSGYLITDILLKQYAKSGRLDLRDFWIRRARRLLPAMMIMLALVTAWLLITDSERLASMKGEIVSALLYYSNWRLIFHDVSYFESFGPPSPLGHLWSLAVEEQFYLVWPMALLLLIRGVKRRGRLMLWMLAGAAASAGAMAWIYVPGLDPSRVYYGTDTRAFGLLIGAALAVVWPSWKLNASISRRARLAVDAIGTGGLLVVALMIALVGEYDAFLYRGGMVVLSIAAAAVVAAMAHPASRLARAIGCRPMQWLGARSYGIYLYHYPVIALTTPAAQVDEFHPLRALLQVLASMALAELSWRYVEEPIRHGALGKLRSWLVAGSGVRRTGRSRGLMLAGICALVVASVSCSNQNNLVQGDNGKAQTGEGQTVGVGASDSQGEGVSDSGTQGTTPDVGSGSTHQDEGSESDIGSEAPGMDTGTDMGGAHNGGSDSVKPGSPDGTAIGSNGDSNGGKDTAGGSPADSGTAGETVDNGSSGGAGTAGGSHGGSGVKDPAGTGGSTDKPGSSGSGGDSAPPADDDGDEQAEIPPAIAADGITVIGDSVILDAKPFLEKLIQGIVVDGKVGRQFTQADDVVADLKKQNRLGKTVVIELGTNGSFTEKQLDQLMEAIGADHTVYFVNTRVPRKWQDTVNDMLSDAAANLPNTKLIDWYAASKDHLDFFGKDGVHLKRSGGEFFADLIAGSLQ
ncbi:acyltransferase family protein [Paenibacillus sacheonensis]|uniref:Acyltransferase family protein n=1 Tax=Paenibacillus sacheonensis TaxID=742054 RepID=A0A7X5C0K1_9BACL|nr:acyltransferase family protein [Paenibacillus sacheonensis]MBM7568338.1 peptidoglycan/LPS O-acetylase OafA/YrhL [Paenibacillus sacheonensis]NBC68479.1 acyltransferase family protein [Paenibacillus sacheonensis]